MKYLYIGGMGRSGSTLMSGLLAQRPEFVEVGELRGIWRAVRADELCSCGADISACEFWRLVAGRAFGGWDEAMVERMIATDESVLRHRQLPQLLAGGLRREADSYVTAMSALVHAIATISRAQVVVDSTKDFPFFQVVRRFGGLDLYLVHLIRNPKGVAFSWTRSVERPEFARHSDLRGTPMARFSILRSSIEWAARCALFETARLGDVPAQRIRYEELVSDPEGCARRLERWCGVDRNTEAADSEKVVSSVRHTVGGNRVRFNRGPIEVVSDMEWRSAMRRRDRWVVDAVTFPLALRYGYFTRLPGGSVSL